MNRKIGWESYEFDEIELVYEKAADKDTSQKENGKGNSSFWERCRKMIMGIKRKK